MPATSKMTVSHMRILVFTAAILVQLTIAQPGVPFSISLISEDEVGISLCGTSEDEVGMSLTSSTEDEAGLSLVSSEDEVGMSLTSSTDDEAGLSLVSSEDEAGLSLDSLSSSGDIDRTDPICDDYAVDIETVNAKLPPPRDINSFFFAEVSSGKKMKSKALSLLSIKSALKEKCVCGQNCLSNINFKIMRELRNSYWLNSRTVRMQLLRYYISQSQKAGKFRYITIQKWTLCSKAICIALRVNKNTFSRAITMDNRHKLSIPGKKPRDMSENSLILMNWLEDYGTYHGDRMPDSTDVLLPYKSVKIDLFRKYRQETQNFSWQKSVSRSQFFNMWDTYFPHLKIKKTNSFSKCTLCTTLERQMENTACVVTRGRIKMEKDAHNTRQMLERKYYYGKRDISRKNPRSYLSMIIDGMDQSKTNLPHFTGRLSKNIKGTDLLKTHVSGVISHGHGGFHTFVDINEYRHDPNLTINILLKMLKRMADEHENRLPPTFYIQADNCGRENKNRYMLAFCELLVLERIFNEVYLSFLYVGHTHEDVDAGFSHIAEKLRKTDVEVMDDFLKILPKPEMISFMFNVKEWLEPEIKHLSGISVPLHFRFLRVEDNIVTYYKGQQSSAWIEFTETVLKRIPEGEPSLLQPDYDKLEIDKQLKQVETVQNFFRKSSTLATWKDFYGDIESGIRVPSQHHIWTLPLLPRQSDTPDQEIVVLPEEIRLLIEKDTVVPKVTVVNRKKRGTTTTAQNRNGNTGQGKSQTRKKKTSTNGECAKKGICRLSESNTLECTCCGTPCGDRCDKCTESSECISGNVCTNGVCKQA